MSTATVPAVIGHRGAAAHAPENTLAGLRAAAALGVRWVEFDVALSADGQPILFHDDTLNRTTNGSGPVGDHTLAALRALDAGSWFDASFAGEPIPTLTEAIEVLAQCRLGANVEIKPAPGREIETAEAVVATLRKHRPALPPPLLSSFSEDAMETLARLRSPFPRALLVEEIPPDWRGRLARLGCTALHCHAASLARAQAEEVRQAGAPLRCYTVNDPEEARRLFAWGVGGVFSDVPDRILAALSSSPQSDSDAGSNTR